MNEKQPYEKHLREKLQQLAPPGQADDSWPQMKRMLDQHLPEEKDRPGGGWWLLLLVGIILLSGTWILTRKPAGSRVAADQPALANNPADAQRPNRTGPDPAIPENTSPSGDARRSPDAASTGLPPAGQDQPNSGHASGQTASIAVIPSGANKQGELSLNNPSTSSPIDHTSTPDRTQHDPIASGKTNHKPGGTVGRNKRGNDPRAGLFIQDNPVAGTDRETDAELNHSIVAGVVSNAGSRDYSLNFGRLREDNLLEVSPSPVDKMQIRRWIRFGVKEKSAKNSPRVVGSGTSKEYVFGLSLPLAFPLADQKAVGYNFNAGQNTVTDYLPTAHFQYHFNDRSYLQTEVQFISPQYIQPVLLSSERVDLPAGSSYQYLTHNVYARKLYYFNLPVGVHYSPFRHFYLGTGLQFSSLLSGVAQFNDMAYSGGNGTLLREDYRRFHNDSLSSKLSNSEFRLMLDANYYWNRFTVGFRYNQALSNYVDIQVVPGGGYEQDKNKSLQFYLRYNLWELKRGKSK